MPQPLSRVAPNASFSLGIGGQRLITEKEPRLALMAMEVISSWSNVENFLLRLYIALMGSSNELATTVYLSLETQSAKTQAIQAIARQVLEPRHLALLNAILGIAKTHQKSRDKIAHHVWGHCAALPGALLLADPKSTLLPRQSLDVKALSALDFEDLTEKVVAYSESFYIDIEKMKEKIFVYREIDFQSAIDANDRICRFAARTALIVSGNMANKRDRLYNMLCAEPEIRERLDRQAARD